MSKFVWHLTLDLSSMVEPAGGMKAPAGIAGTAPGGPKGTQATTPTARYRHHGRKIPQVNVSGVIFVDFLFILVLAVRVLFRVHRSHTLHKTQHF